MQCNNHKDCNRRLRKLIKKVNKEIVKVDKFFESCNNNDESIICHNPSKDEKKQIINAIKVNSSASCTLIEELKMHRTEVKYLSNAFSKLMQKHEKLKTLQKKQSLEVEKLYCSIKNNLSRMMNNRNKEKSAIDWRKIQEQENSECEKIFDYLTSQLKSLTKEYDDLSKHITDRSNDIVDEMNRDKMLFSLATRYIQKAFNIKAKLESKYVNFLDYAFPNTNDDDSDSSEGCCCTTD